MRAAYLILICVLVLTHEAQAQPQPQETEGRYEQYAQAVAIGARVDAYGAYCDKETQLGKTMLDKARQDNAEAPEKDSGLLVIQETVYAETMKELKERAVECKDVGFLLEKLDLMKMLKTTVAAINGKETDEVIENTADNPL